VDEGLLGGIGQALKAGNILQESQSLLCKLIQQQELTMLVTHDGDQHDFLVFG
jgi:hypothetical protein